MTSDQRAELIACAQAASIMAATLNRIADEMQGDDRDGARVMAVEMESIVEGINNLCQR